MRLLVVVGVVALLVAGCSKGSAPSKTDYAAAADGVCAAVHDELQKTTAEHQKAKPDGGANQRFVRATVIPRLRSMTGALRGIPPPEGQGPYLNTIYADYDHALDLWYSDPLGTTSDSAGNAAEARMESYGMGACANAGDIQVDG